MRSHRRKEKNKKMAKLVKIVDYTRPYSDSKGSVRPSVNYRLEVPRGDGVSFVTIVPAFKKEIARDYFTLDVMADEVRKVGVPADLENGVKTSK